MLICLPPSKESWQEGLLYLSGSDFSSNCYLFVLDIYLSEGNRTNFLYVRVV